MIHFVLLVVCAGVIYLACEWFVNAVEWLGQRLKVGPLAVGTILAAFGTALPESVVTFVAVVFGHGAAAKDIGVGAAMGGPLALSTVAYGVTGWMMLARRRRIRAISAARVFDARPVPVPGPAGPADPPATDRPPAETANEQGDLGKLARDQRWFLAIFVVKVALGLVAFAAQVAVAHLWFRRFYYGPLEWLWRAGTYLTLDVPFVRRAGPDGGERVPA